MTDSERIAERRRREIALAYEDYMQDQVREAEELYKLMEAQRKLRPLHMTGGHENPKT